jgi:hypothetical protein
MREKALPSIPAGLMLVAPLTAAHTRRTHDADGFALNTVECCLADRAPTSDCLILATTTVDPSRGIASPTTWPSGTRSPNNTSFAQLAGQAFL